MTTVDPAEIEATGVTTIDLSGYTWPASADDWDIVITEALEQGKAITAIRHLLGPDQFTAFKKTNPKNRDAAALLESYLRALGLRPGE